jgi:ABC-2 type transport system ATP-binding protein
VGDDAAVRVQDLHVSYGARPAVRGLDLQVRTGTVTAVLGPNGAGKTTTVEVCEGLRRPDSGRVSVLGLDPRTDGPALRPRLGVMLQSGGIYPGARAVEMVRHVAALHAHPQDPLALAERLGIADLGRTPYRRMSGGEKQRLAFAVAVVGRPELVFLDEPSAGLDPQGRLAVWEVVEELRRDGVTVVLTTHLMEEAEHLADEVVIVDEGQVVASGTPEVLTAGEDGLRFRAPLHLDVRALESALPEGCRVSEGPPGLYRVEGHVDPAVLSAVTAWCAQHGVMPRDLSIARRSLEDVFLELTGKGLRP